MSALTYTLGVLLFVLGVAVSIGLHELGHMIPGKLFGVKVTQYFVGFGPTLWSRQRGETEYGVKAVPLGGYVKQVGMLPPGDRTGTRPSRSRGAGPGPDRAARGGSSPSSSTTPVTPRATRSSACRPSGSSTGCRGGRRS